LTLKSQPNHYTQTFANSQIFANFRKFSQIFANFRKFSQIFANFRKFSQIFANFRKLSQIFANFRKFSQKFANFRKLSKCANSCEKNSQKRLHFHKNYCIKNPRIYLDFAKQSIKSKNLDKRKFIYSGYKRKIIFNDSKTKAIVNYPIFVTEKKKRFPSTLKSVSEYLYDFCLLYIVEDIKLDFDKSTILNIDGRLFESMRMQKHLQL
jgi:hypothetical protein